MDEQPYRRQRGHLVASNVKLRLGSGGSQGRKHRDGKQQPPDATELVDRLSRVRARDKPTRPIQHKSHREEKRDGPSFRPSRPDRISIRHKNAPNSDNA